MITFAKNKYALIRVVAHHDWVVFVVTGCILLYVFMLLYLHRDSSVRVFLTEQYADASNQALSWFIIGLVHVLALSTLLSAWIPAVPNSVRHLQLFGYELNRFGFAFVVLFLFYSLRSLFTYLFLAGTGGAHRWPQLQFMASKFYFIFSIMILMLCIVQYYFDLEMSLLYDYYFIGFAVVFLVKIVLYMVSPQHVLPLKWYYKFLYICTLQIAPVLAVWRVLYF